MKRITLFLFGAWFMSILTCIVVWAQATAQISGTARDQSGAVLPGVEIAVTQTDTGIVRNTVTNETGSYVLPNLAIGPYRLEAALPGFRIFVQTGIVLQVNSSPVVNVVLEVGALAETVEVQANAALVETQNSGIGQVIENARILELPLNGRNVTDLIVLAGGATPGNPGFGTSGALSRTFRSRETPRLEFRAEAFNVTNSLVKNNPVTNFESSNFGQINSARDPRIMQFALKYIF